MKECNFLHFEEWTGAELNNEWEWWRENGKVVLDRPDGFVFIDEAQDLSLLHQKELFRVTEKAEEMLILATTHIHRLNDALVGRFGVNCFELRRPSLNEAISLMEKTCDQLGIKISIDVLDTVASHYQLNLRTCVDFVYTVKDQLPNSSVTTEILADYFGISKQANFPEDETVQL